MADIALIDYGAGNIPSVLRALEVALINESKMFEIIVTDDPDLVRSADRIVIPGVGHFRDCQEGLLRPEGMEDALNEAFAQQAKPILGICVGMQLMADCGFEDGETKGLGWISGNVDAIPDTGLPIPHMGWNELVVQSEHPVLKDVHTGDHAYFVHSYHFINSNPDECLAVANYGAPVTAVIGKNTAFGVQFHPEISQNTGMKIFENWINWRP